MTTTHSPGKKRQIGDAFHSLPLPKGIVENNQLHMPIKARPYDHQRRAFTFACQIFGLETGVNKLEDRGQMRVVRETVSEGQRPDSQSCVLL